MHSNPEKDEGPLQGFIGRIQEFIDKNDEPNISEEEPNADTGHLQKFIEQLYEDERLTDALVDESAALLLNWGEGQLKRLYSLNLGSTELERAAHQLRRILLFINRLVGQRTDLSEPELVQRLIRLVDKAMQLSTSEQQEIKNGQETQIFQETIDSKEKGD